MVACCKTIVPLYFYESGNKTAAENPVEYAKSNWGDRVYCCNPNELRFEAETMVLMHISCSKLAIEDLSHYTTMIASVLGVKQTILGREALVYN